MRCPRCASPMRESRRSHHKKRKWICPRCGRAKLVAVKKQRKRNRRGGAGC